MRGFSTFLNNIARISAFLEVNDWQRLVFRLALLITFICQEFYLHLLSGSRTYYNRLTARLYYFSHRYNSVNSILLVMSSTDTRKIQIKVK